MKTVVDALKDLHVAFGGQAADVADCVTVVEVIEKMTAVVGGGSLPAVTAADNGKVLTVVEGAWAKADAPDELPVVTADDNGKVLTVANGDWAAADLPSGTVV